VAPATNTFMGASFPIHLRADTSRDKIALLPVTHPVSPLDAPTRPEGCGQHRCEKIVEG
jgi:hypothetical protein